MKRSLFLLYISVVCVTSAEEKADKNYFFKRAYQILQGKSRKYLPDETELHDVTEAIVHQDSDVNQSSLSSWKTVENLSSKQDDVQPVMQKDDTQVAQKLSQRKTPPPIKRPYSGIVRSEIQLPRYNSDTMNPEKGNLNKRNIKFTQHSHTKKFFYEDE